MTIEGDVMKLRVIDLTDPDAEGTPVQWVGCYVLNWRSEWGQPTIGFAEVDDEGKVDDGS